MGGLFVAGLLAYRNGWLITLTRRTSVPVSFALAAGLRRVPYPRPWVEA